MVSKTPPYGSSKNASGYGSKDTTNEDNVNTLPQTPNEVTYATTGSYFGQQQVRDSITRTVGRGGLSTALSANLYGFDHMKVGAPLAKHKEQYGYAFFTRPRIRLSKDNLKFDRSFKLLDSKDEYSVYRWVRATLDPVHRKDYANSPLVDGKNVFIPILTNSLMNMSGWPEIGVDVYTSSEGLRKEQWSMADGFAKHYGTFNISCEFENMAGNYIPELFWYWTQYALLAHEGVMEPFYDSILENEIDYQTRIYRLVMDQTRTYVVDIAATGIAFPTNPSIASRFDYDKNEIFNKSNDTVSISFQATGAIYKDPILMSEFNLSVQAFNIGMHDSIRAKQYQLLTPAEALQFNHFGYPRINLDTGRLEWWVDKADYLTIKKSFGVLSNGHIEY